MGFLYHNNIVPYTKCPKIVKELFIKILREMETKKLNENNYFEVGEEELGN